MTIYVKHGFPLRSTQWDIFCGKKLGKLDHKKNLGLGGPPDVAIDAEFGDHFSHDLSLKRDKPICLFLTPFFHLGHPVEYTITMTKIVVSLYFVNVI